MTDRSPPAGAKIEAEIKRIDRERAICPKCGGTTLAYQVAREGACSDCLNAAQAAIVGEAARRALRERGIIAPTPAGAETVAKSTMRINAEADPGYAPYCLRCTAWPRMQAVERFYWRCRNCGAEHDERTPPASPAGAEEPDEAAPQKRITKMEACEICGNELHSVTTRRIGDHQFCRDCGDTILTHTNRLINDILSATITEYKLAQKRFEQKIGPTLPLETAVANAIGDVMDGY